MSALKYLGVVILLIGVAVLIGPTLMGNPGNTYLLAGLAIILVGFIGHIILNKKIE
jgi:hypothetical protein